uniref:Uncharacterized protein n=1 Tax=Onchocerca volvulus TaxID=6282 RepID=A0A8R1XY94_ONCVO
MSDASSICNKKREAIRICSTTSLLGRVLCLVKNILINIAKYKLDSKQNVVHLIDLSNMEMVERKHGGKLHKNLIIIIDQWVYSSKQECLELNRLHELNKILLLNAETEAMELNVK